MQFVDNGPLAELTYDAEGKPIAIARGKQRDRDEDIKQIMDWMRALASQVK